MRKIHKHSERDKLKQELIQKYGISDEDLEKLKEERDLLSTGIIIVLFAVAGLYAVSGFF